jgi:hypothetical protein
LLEKEQPLEIQSEVRTIYAKLALDTRKLSAEWPGHFRCKERGTTTHWFSGSGGEKGIIEARHKGRSQLQKYYGLLL